MKRFSGALTSLLLVLVLASPALAALTFPLNRYEVRVEYQSTKTRAISRTFIAGKPYFVPGNYHWQGLPIGMLIINGRSIQAPVKKNGRVLSRCKFQAAYIADRQWVAIDRALMGWQGRSVVEAGPCIQWVNGHVFVSWKDEGFDPWFVVKKAWRNIVCVNNDVTEVVVFRYYGPLTPAALQPKMQAYRMQDCMNLDGGSTVATGRSVVTIGFYPR